MARYPYQSFIQDGNGRAIEDVTVTVYEADTTTGATIYAAKSGGSAITGSYVTTSASGYFLFYIDTVDYTEKTFFDIVPAKSGYEFDTIEDIIVPGSTDYQSLDAALTDISGLAVTNGNFIVGDGTNWVAESGATAQTSLGISAFAQTILDDANAAAVRATIGSSSASARLNKTQADSPYTVTAANCSGMITITNTGATGETIFNLPAGADGYVFKGLVTVAQYMQFLCDGTEKIRWLSFQTAAGGYVRSNVVGNVIEGTWSGTEWVITGIGGAWTYDS